MIASHYAEPLVRHLVTDAPFLAEPADDDGLLAKLASGDEMRVLDISRGTLYRKIEEYQLEPEARPAGRRGRDAETISSVVGR